jgi:co-chaperonin GroES (HSP10)
MTRTPARGLLLIKKPTLQDTVGGIVLLQKTREGWTAGQAEVVAVGPPAYAEDDEEEAVDGVIPVDPRLKPGTWVLTKFRNWVQTDKPDEWMVNQSDVLAILD